MGALHFSNKRVLLDVGGRHFSTTLETLMSVPGSYFHQLFSAKIPEDMMTFDGRVFIDRSGVHFRHVLNFLRAPGKFVLRVKSKEDLEDLREETIFYGIEGKVFENSVFVPDKLEWLDEKKIKVSQFSTEHSSSYAASNVLNYGLTYWLSLPGTVTDQWLVFDFGVEAYISKISIKVDNFQCSVKDFSVQQSEGDECKEWVTLKEFQAICGNTCTTDQNFEGFEFRGRYMRLFCKNNWGPGGGNFILITNVKFYGALIV